MATHHHPHSVGHDNPVSTQPAQHHSHIPRGYQPDHQQPGAYVVRCSACGRLTVEDGRGNAHRHASTHALTCDGNAGVTPISQLDDDPDDDEDEDALELEAGALDPRRVDLTGSTVAVTYRSVQGRSGHQRRHVTVHRMLPASLDEDRQAWRGFEATAENGATLRIEADHDEPAVQVCYNDAQRQIGTLDSVQPTCTTNGAPVATDGGEP